MPRNDSIQVRRDTAANWTSVNPTLASGEIGLETNTGRYKIGNGTTPWNALGADLTVDSLTAEYQVEGDVLISYGPADIGTDLSVGNDLEVANNATISGTSNIIGGVFLGDGIVDASALDADSISQSGDYLSPYNGFRNKVINGNMSVWQRGTSVAVSTLGYTADRWFHQSYNGATISRQPTSDTSVLPNVQYCARVQRNSGVTSTNFMYFTQSMETQESIKLRGKTITLSFYARKGANFSDTSNAFEVILYYGTGTDQNLMSGGYTGSGGACGNTFTLTSSWVRYSVTGTIPTTSTELTPLFGYLPTGTAGANDYFEITGVQLEEGSVATPFEQRPIGTELALCQRYFQLINSYMGVADFNVPMVRESATQGVSTIFLPVSMRVLPSLYGATYGRCVFRDTAFGVVAPSVSSISVSNAGPSFNAITLIIVHGSAAGTYVFSEWDMLNTAANLGLSAEL